MQMEVIDMGVRYTHANGRTLEMVGEQEDGEWFAYEANGDCFAQGFYEDDEEGEGIFFSDADGRDMNTDLPVEHDQLEAFVEVILLGLHLPRLEV